MTIEIALVLSIALAAVLLFAAAKLRMDAVALLVLASLALTGLVTTERALSGFSNSATITVAAMFVLAAGLQNSGALAGISNLLGRAKSPSSCSSCSPSWPSSRRSPTTRRWWLS